MMKTFVPQGCTKRPCDSNTGKIRRAHRAQLGMNSVRPPTAVGGAPVLPPRNTAAVSGTFDDSGGQHLAPRDTDPSDSIFGFRWKPRKDCHALSFQAAGTSVVSYTARRRSLAMQLLLTSPYWSPKLRILILTAATFAALC